MNDAARAIPADSQLKRDMPLVPADSIAGRALVVVIAIMTFLACLTAGGAILVARGVAGVARRRVARRHHPDQAARRRGRRRRGRLGGRDRLARARRRRRGRLHQGAIGGDARPVARRRGRPRAIADPAPDRRPHAGRPSRRSRTLCAPRSPPARRRQASTTTACGCRASTRWPARSSLSPPRCSR